MPLEIDIPAASTDRFQSVLSAEQLDDFEQGATEARRLLEGRCVWNVNSTAHGGGVVELLRPLVSYARGLGLDARWIVIDGPPAFFEVTKRIHNRLHGADGDGLRSTTRRTSSTRGCSRTTPPSSPAGCRRGTS